MTEDRAFVRKKWAYFASIAGLLWIAFAMIGVPLILDTYYQGQLLGMRLVALGFGVLGYSVVRRRAQANGSTPTYGEIARWSFGVACIPAVLVAGMAARNAPEQVNSIGIGIGGAVSAMIAILLWVVSRRHRPPGKMHKKHTATADVPQASESKGSDRLSDERTVSARALGAYLAKLSYEAAFTEDTAIWPIADGDSVHVGHRLSHAEALITAAFPYDIGITSSFEQEDRAVRAAFHSGLVECLRAVGVSEPAQYEDTIEFRHLLLRRFTEYGAIVGTMGSGDSLMRYSLAAARNISGVPDPLLSGRIAIGFSMTLKHDVAALRSYSIVE